MKPIIVWLLLMTFIVPTVMGAEMSMQLLDDFESGCGDWTQRVSEATVTIACTGGVVQINASVDSKIGLVTYDYGFTANNWTIVSLVRITAEAGRNFVGVKMNHDDSASWTPKGYGYSIEDDAIATTENVLLQDVTDQEDTFSLTGITDGGWWCMRIRHDKATSGFALYPNATPDTCDLGEVASWNRTTSDVIAAAAQFLAIGFEGGGASPGHGDIWIEAVWYNTTFTPEPPPIVVAVSYPASHQQFTAANLSAIANTIYINGTHDNETSATCGINDTRFTSLGANDAMGFNYTFVNNTPLNTEIHFDVVTFCNQTGSSNGTAQITFDVSSSIPAFATVFVGNITFMNNLTGQWNVTDDDFVHSVNVSIDGTSIFQVENLGAQKYILNLSYDIRSLSLGAHNLTVRFADGHTSSKLDGDYGEDNGLFNDYLIYTFPDSGWVKTYQKSSTIFDHWDSEKQTDRYIQVFTPATPGNTFTFVEESDKPIHIYGNKQYGQWIVLGDHWKDYLLQEDPNAKVAIKRISDYSVEVTISNIVNNQARLTFNSVGDLNIIEQNYTFYQINMTEEYTTLIFNGYDAEYQLNVSFGNLSFDVSSITPTARIEWDGTNLTGLLQSFTTEKAIFTHTQSTVFGASPDIIPHKWFFNLSSLHTPNWLGTDEKNQTSSGIQVGKCNATLTDKIVNISYYDEISDLGITATNAYQLSVFDGTFYYNQTGVFAGQFSDAFCTNIDSTNATVSWSSWGTVTLSSAGYTTRVLDIAQGAPFTFSNNPTQNVSLYLIDVANSTTVTYNWFTTNLQVVDGTMRIFQCTPNGTVDLVDSIPIIAGQGSANIELLSQPYSYDIVIGDVVYQDFDGYSKCHIESLTELTFYVDIVEEDITDLIGLYEIQCSLNKTSNTTLTMTWGQNPQNTGYVQGCMQVRRQAITGNVLVFENCSVEADGYSRSLTVPNTGNQFVISGKLIQGNNTRFCDNDVVFFQGTDATRAFGVTSLLAVVFLVAAIALMFTGEGLLQLVGTGVGVLGAYGLGMLNVPWTVITAILAFLLIIGLVGRYGVKK